MEQPPQIPDAARAAAREAAAGIAKEGLPLDRSLAQLLDALNMRTAQVQRLLAIIDGLTGPSQVASLAASGKEG